MNFQEYSIIIKEFIKTLRVFTKKYSVLLITRKLIQDFRKRDLELEEYYQSLSKYLNNIDKDDDVPFLEEFNEYNNCSNNFGIKDIILTKKEASILADVIFYFKKVRRGKGFDIKFIGVKIIKKISFLKKKHPYFFILNKNDKIYPTRLCLELGETILSLRRVNKDLINLKIQDYNFKIV